MARVSNGLWVVALVAVALLAGRSAGAAEAYDELPEGAAPEVARLYYSALALPGVSDWEGPARAALLDVATRRYRDRLIDRASPVSDDTALRHIVRLSASDLALGHPHVVGQACARYGLLTGPCSPHAGYVRRALVVEEMLVQGQLTLSALEIELVGASRPAIRAPHAAP